MWRSRSLAEWERKKSYLIRSLFEDIPTLSPILEGHEPTSPSSPSHYIYRPESPLPELIIEVEPKKPNLHDEPAELYEELAKEMRRLYRKDFLNTELSTSSSENSSSESLNRGRIYDNSMSDESDSANELDENVLNDKCQIDYAATEHQKENDIDAPTQSDISTSTKSSESIHIASKSVIVQVDIHSQEYEVHEDLACEQQGFKESNQYIQSEENSINVTKTTIIESIEVGDDNADKEESSDTYSFAKDTDASSSDSNSDSSVKSSHASPEIMRERQVFESLETPPTRLVSKSNSTVSNTVHLSMEVDSNELSEDVLAFNQEIDIAEDSDNETLLLVTSTPTRKRTSRCSTKRTHKRRLVSYSSSSSFASSVSAANAALQTSFSDCEKDASFFWSNFFVGMPTVYNVCSCNHHVCT